MDFVRRLLCHRRIVLLLCVATLVVKLLIPTGYMIAEQHGRITVAICSGTAARSMTIALPMAAETMPDHGSSDADGLRDMPCAFAGLSAAVLGAIDPSLLVVLIAFIMALGRWPSGAPPLRRTANLRPPLRGPPACL